MVISRNVTSYANNPDLGKQCAPLMSAAANHDLGTTHARHPHPGGGHFH